MKASGCVAAMLDVETGSCTVDPWFVLASPLSAAVAVDQGTNSATDLRPSATSVLLSVCVAATPGAKTARRCNSWARGEAAVTWDAVTELGGDGADIMLAFRYRIPLNCSHELLVLAAAAVHALPAIWSLHLVTAAALAVPPAASKPAARTGKQACITAVSDLKHMSELSEASRAACSAQSTWLQSCSTDSACPVPPVERRVQDAASSAKTRVGVNINQWLQPHVSQLVAQWRTRMRVRSTHMRIYERAMRTSRAPHLIPAARRLVLQGICPSDLQGIRSVQVQDA